MDTVTELKEVLKNRLLALAPQLEDRHKSLIAYHVDKSPKTIERYLAGEVGKNLELAEEILNAGSQIINGKLIPA